jgi:formylmethanofuran dehydrogenase subunit D
MKNPLLILVVFISTPFFAQENLEDLLAAGIEDAKRFTTGYITPATEAMIYNTANGWVQTAKVKDPLKFEISIIANATFVSDENKSFNLNTADYNNLHFRDGSTVKDVATAFGENNPDIVVYAEVQNGAFTEEIEFVLPQGLASVNVNVVPSAFLQARLGLFKGAEIKARYFPKIDQEDVKVGLIGAGFQYEFTKLLPADNVFPVAISGVVGYTNLTANYDFTDTDIVEGENQQFDFIQNSWVFQLQASTNLPVINFYGGLGYVTGTSDFDVLGTYRVRGGIPLFETTNEFTDPYSISTKVTGVRGTIGAKLQLGFFGLHADYNIAEYSNISAGVHFGI